MGASAFGSRDEQPPQGWYAAAFGPTAGRLAAMSLLQKVPRKRASRAGRGPLAKSRLLLPGLGHSQIQDRTKAAN